MDYHRKYGAEHKRKIRSIPENKVKCYISNHIRYCLKRVGGLKDGSVFDSLPYTSTDLKLHLENNFEHWMTWDNWGVYIVELWDDNDSSTWTWQIDHIIPTVMFPYDSMNHPNFQKCWSLDNLRQFKSKDNLYKGDRFE